jgi:hypothetical protein
MSVVVEVSKHLMRVEVVLLNIKRSRHLSSVVYVCYIKHLLLIKVINDVSSLRVNQVASLIGWVAILVNIFSSIIL